MLGILIFVLLGVAAVCVCAAISERSNALEERLAEMSARVRVAYGTLEPEEIESDTLAHALFKWALKKVPEPKLSEPEVAKIAKIMVQAGYHGNRAMHVFQLVRILSAIGVTAAALVAGAFLEWSGARTVLALVCGATLGSWLPLQILTHRAHKRSNEISGQLSNVLDLLVVCVEAGLGITEAIKMVGSEADRQGQLIGRELSMVSAELNSGTGLGHALRALAERTQIEDIKPLAATM
ncbi:MAG TPA: type II secretion system F family protein, partial [Candidatus Binataceae bacterium]|nr:type II secretion system F family protein [Candidatus Binataceae bacterium]